MYNKMAKGGRRSRKAGSLASLINQAVVPFGILALQQSYKKKHGGRRTRRGGKRRSYRRH
jgi:hypothetical protein